MTDKIQGATAAPTKMPEESWESRLSTLAKNYTLLAQGVVNQHYELTRAQLLMDCVLSSNPSLKYPDTDEISDIDRKALNDARSTYASFFPAGTKSVDSVK